mmetsp:Transcript_79273/g.149563  ORF Transcript_79273/g.149563 Transcript_79273/m.149563 type:complete len:82 (+) Transcript_79273:864-1109(+)
MLGVPLGVPAYCGDRGCTAERELGSLGELFPDPPDGAGFGELGRDLDQGVTLPVFTCSFGDVGFVTTSIAVSECALSLLRG